MKSTIGCILLISLFSSCSDKSIARQADDKLAVSEKDVEETAFDRMIADVNEVLEHESTSLLTLPDRDNDGEVWNDSFPYQDADAFASKFGIDMPDPITLWPKLEPSGVLVTKKHRLPISSSPEQIMERYNHLASQPVTLTNYFGIGFLQDTIRRSMGDRESEEFAPLVAIEEDVMKRRKAARIHYAATLLKILDRLPITNEISIFAGQILKHESPELVDYEIVVDEYWREMVEIVKSRQIAELQLGSRREYYSSQERDLMVDGSVKVRVPSKPFPPSEEAVRLAVARGIGQQANCANVAPGVVTRMKLGLSIRVNQGLRTEITSVEFVEPPKLLDDRLTYSVKFIATSKVTVIGDSRRLLEADEVGRMFGRITGLTTGATSKEELNYSFQFTEEGWIALEIAQREAELRTRIIESQFEQ